MDFQAVHRPCIFVRRWQQAIAPASLLQMDKRLQAWGQRDVDTSQSSPATQAEGHMGKSPPTSKLPQTRSHVS